MLAEAGIADVAMAPAADMFELGVKLQVLKRGTMFAARANKLYELYRAHDSLEAMPADVRAQGSRTKLLGASLDQRLGRDRAFWAERDPPQLARAAARPEAPHGAGVPLVPRQVEPLGHRRRRRDRRADYQIWCGPAMGAFNALGARLVPRSRAGTHRRADRAQPARRRRGRRPAGPAAARFRRRRCPRARSTSGRAGCASSARPDPHESRNHVHAEPPPADVPHRRRRRRARCFPAPRPRSASGATSSPAGTASPKCRRTHWLRRGLLRPGTRRRRTRSYATRGGFLPPVAFDAARVRHAAERRCRRRTRRSCSR